MGRSRFFVSMLSVLTVTAVGCSDSDSSRSSNPLAARVNSEEIILQEVQALLARRPGGIADGTTHARREAVELLIEQKLAVQQALDRKLDRSPEVRRAVDAARSEVLARAYFQHVVAAQPKPTADEISEYYARHRQLFAQRRWYSLEEISLATSEATGLGLEERAAKARSIDEIADWLKSRSISFQLNHATRASEQIAPEILPKLQAMQPGELRLIQADADTLVVIGLVAAKAAPVDEAGAAALIEQSLASRRRGEAIADEIQRLKKDAKIEYLGEFAVQATGARAELSARQHP